MTRGERIKKGLLRPAEVARLAGVPQSVLRHHYQSGYVPAPSAIDGRRYYTRAQARAVKMYFAGRAKYERTAVAV